MTHHDTQAFERQRDDTADRLTSALGQDAPATFTVMQQLLITIERDRGARSELRSYIGGLDLDDQHPTGEPS
jgi:hypothetical protein